MRIFGNRLAEAPMSRIYDEALERFHLKIIGMTHRSIKSASAEFIFPGPSHGVRFGCLVRFHSGSDQQNLGVLRRPLRLNAIEPGTHVKFISDTGENRIILCLDRDFDIGAGVVTEMRVTIASPAAGCAEDFAAKPFVP